MDDLYLLSLGAVSPTGSLIGLLEEEEERTRDEARAQLARGAALLVEGSDHDLPVALELFDDAIDKAPALRSHAWERGWVLYHLNRLQEARAQFEASCEVDDDDAEPWLWRFLCDARLHGLRVAQQGLHDFKGWDKRLCMMQVLSLFKGEGTVEEVLEGSCGDRHSAARASFAAALYFEAANQPHLAMPLLAAVAELDSHYYMYALARCHLRRLQRRLAAQGAGVRVHPGPLTSALSPRRLNAPFPRAAIVSPLSQSC